MIRLSPDASDMKGLLSGPAYEPPYDGAVQDEFAWHIVKYLREDAVLRSEVSLETPAAFFTVDFVAEVPGPIRPRRIAIECGGERNLRDHQRRLRRDATLIASNRPDGQPVVDALYRLRGSDLLDHMEDCLYLVAQWERSAPAGSPPTPDLFSERGRINLETLATREAKNLRLRPEQAAAMVTYEIDPEQEEYFSERHLWHTANGTNPFILLRRFDRRFSEAWEVHVDEAVTRPHRLRPTGS
jgi:hypothetical protein